MGAHELYMVLKGNLTENEVKNKFYERQENDLKEYGENPYNGSFSTFCGIDIKQLIFSSRLEAENYILNKSEKWEKALAVKILNEQEDFWLIGGWAAS